VVRFGRDELPFSPSDLVLLPKGAAAGRSVAATATARRSTETVRARQGASAPGPELKLTEPPAPGPAARTAPPDAAPPAPLANRAEPAAVGEPVEPAEQPPAPRKAGRPAKLKPPATLTVTLAYTEGEWTVAATQGAKALAKPYVIKPAEALKMVALLDVPGVQEAVEHIVAAERAVAQEHAERLRSQLAEVEAKLAELGELS
jgi:hypothetical protein